MDQSKLINDAEQYAKYKYLQRRFAGALFRNVMEIVFPVILLMFAGGTAVALVGYWWFHELVPAFILGAVPFLCAVSMVHWFIGKDRLDHVVGFMTVFSINKYSDKAAQIKATYPCIQHYDFGRWIFPESWWAMSPSDSDMIDVEPYYVAHLAKYIELCEQKRRIVTYDEVSEQLTFNKA
jgi:hypothetical protein